MNRKVEVFLILLMVVILSLTAAGCGGTNSSASAASPGQELFAGNCARCHGADGQGAIGPSLQHETDPAKVTNQVRNGGQIMPAFGAKLSDAQISAVAEYVLSLGSK